MISKKHVKILSLTLFVSGLMLIGVTSSWEVSLGAFLVIVGFRFADLTRGE